MFITFRIFGMKKIIIERNLNILTLHYCRKHLKWKVEKIAPHTPVQSFKSFSRSSNTICKLRGDLNLLQNSMPLKLCCYRLLCFVYSSVVLWLCWNCTSDFPCSMFCNALLSVNKQIIMCDNQKTIWLRTSSRRSLSSDRLGVMATSLRTLFQWQTTISVKSLFLMSKLNFPWHSFIPFSHVVLLVTREKRSAPPPLLPLLRKL